MVMGVVDVPASDSVLDYRYRTSVIGSGCFTCFARTSVRAITTPLPGKAIFKMTYTVLGSMLKPTHSLTHLLYVELEIRILIYCH